MSVNTKQTALGQLNATNSSVEIAAKIDAAENFTSTYLLKDRVQRTYKLLVENFLKLKHLPVTEWQITELHTLRWVALPEYVRDLEDITDLKTALSYDNISKEIVFTLSVFYNHNLNQANKYTSRFESRFSLT